eukprot:5140779-Prymnesium_polylepis.4
MGLRSANNFLAFLPAPGTPIGWHCMWHVHVCTVLEVLGVRMCRCVACRDLGFGMFGVRSAHVIVDASVCVRTGRSALVLVRRGELSSVESRVGRVPGRSHLVTLWFSRLCVCLCVEQTNTQQPLDS